MAGFILLAVVIVFILLIKSSDPDIEIAKKIGITVEQYKQHKYTWDRIQEIKRVRWEYDYDTKVLISDLVKSIQHKDSWMKFLEYQKDCFIDEVIEGKVVYERKKKEDKMKNEDSSKNKTNKNKVNKHAKSYTKNILRWTGVIPLAFISCFIAYAAFKLGYRLYYVTDEEGLMFTIASNFSSGVAFVFGGTYIAPKKKRIVSIVLATALCTIALFGIIVVAAKHEPDLIQRIIELIACMAGGVVASCKIYSNESNQDNYNI